MDDEGLAELLGEALAEAGHVVRAAQAIDVLGGGAVSAAFDIAVLELESRACIGADLVAQLRRDAPATKLIALLPCGATAAEQRGVPYDVTIETPARLKTLLAAVDAAS